MLEFLLDNTHEGIVFCDLDGRILFFNRPYEEIFNLSKDRDLHKNIKEIFPDARIPIVAKTGIPEYGVIYHWKSRKLIVNRIPFKEGSKVTGVITQVLFRDIQELKTINEKVDVLQTKIRTMEDQLRKIFRANYDLDDIIGDSYTINQQKKLAEKYAKSSLPVLIIGESGTGKELFAHAIHKMSPRAGRAFLAVNCAAIPRELMESELFGYEPGAFTGAKNKGGVGKFELVEGGTLFFDEIGDMPLEMQAKILRVIEDKQVTKLGGVNPIHTEFGLVAATNRDIEMMVHEGSFRSDLYYRLSTFVLKVPPLKERPEDILPIALQLSASSQCNLFGKTVRFDEEVIRMFTNYDWPGNVRELKNAVDYAVNNLPEDESLIRLHHLPLSIREKMAPSESGLVSFKEAKNKTEKEIIQHALESTAGERKAAAKLLGISRSVLYEKLKKHDLGNYLASKEP